MTDFEQYLTFEGDEDAPTEIRIWTDYEGPGEGELLERAFEGRDLSGLEKMVFGLLNAEGENYYDDAIVDFAERGPFPALEEIFVGDFEYPEETEISWTSVGNLSPLVAAAPALKKLRARGGAIGFFEPVSSDTLEEIILESGGLGAGAIENLAAGSLPNLETLEIWFGDANYGGPTSADAAQPLFEASWPALRRLKLKNAMFSDALVEPLARSSVAAQLTTLDFSMGVFGNEGAELLLKQAAAFPALKVLNLNRTYVSRPMIVTLQEAFGAKVLGSELQSGDGDDRYVYISE